MLGFVARRLGLMVPTLFAISLVSFAIIQLPPGDYATTLVSQLEDSGQTVDTAQLEAIRERYGLDQPIVVQYWTWISNIVLHGDFGQSFQWNQPVADLLSSRLPLTIVLTLSTVLFTWIVAFPIGLYSAVRQYSWGDYVATTVGFLGLAIPNFLLALGLMYIALTVFDADVGGLFSAEYEEAPWSLARFADLLGHLWIPVIVLGTAGTAGLIRILRANLLDELHKPYVVAARSRGLSETRILFKYPLRVAVSPFLSTIGWVLPLLVSGEIVVSQVLSLPTTGPLLLRALRSQDMYLAGAIILLVSVLTVVGTLLSDILLARMDPRVRLGIR
ncbi:ABC transporter permease [Jiangella rhizosphaerae]|uniref:ABC transporter permease n=1 Tax=Jiangella rhizosphaerae TaxID=2293569 RepID=A0A418KV80_9ACTN|nr:ABC transporter permease [Jiangella rhizosphaerae]RIQ33690.1 ABC transporter permease [Jiangella rhizosphaerae]